MFSIRHKANKNAFIEVVVAPPRLSEWTEDITKAQVFESKREVEATVEYIQQIAFDVEYFEVKE